MVARGLQSLESEPRNKEIIRNEIMRNENKNQLLILIFKDSTLSRL